MKTEFAFLVRLTREANEGCDGSEEALRRMHLLLGNAAWSTEPLDADAAITELRDLAREVSPDLRYALARWIDEQITLKRGRKPAGVKRIAGAGPRLPPLSAERCIKALLDFGSTSSPKGLHVNTRRALADLLSEVRTLKRGPRLAPPSTLKTLLAKKRAKELVASGKSARAAIQLAANEGGIKPGTLQRYLYPRKK